MQCADKRVINSRGTNFDKGTANFANSDHTLVVSNFIQLYSIRLHRIRHLIWYPGRVQAPLIEQLLPRARYLYEEIRTQQRSTLFALIDLLLQSAFIRRTSSVLPEPGAPSNNISKGARAIVDTLLIDL